MPFVSGSSNYTPQMKALIQQCGRLTPGTLVGFILPDQDFDLLREQTANRGTSARGQNFGLANDLLRQANCKILLSHKISSRNIRVAHILRVVNVAWP